MENCQPFGLPLEQLARKAGLVQIDSVGRSELMQIGAQEFLDFGLEQFRKNPWLTAKGPPCDIAENIRAETQIVPDSTP